MAPVGVLTNKTLPRMHKKKIIHQGGHLAMVRTAGNRTDVCNQFGTWVERQNIVFFAGYKDTKAQKKLAQKCIWKYKRAISDIQQEGVEELNK
jgi:hypothetical protein